MKAGPKSISCGQKPGAAVKPSVARAILQHKSIYGRTQLKNPPEKLRDSPNIVNNYQHVIQTYTAIKNPELVARVQMREKKLPAALQKPAPVATKQSNVQTQSDSFQEQYYRMNFLQSGAAAAKILDQEYSQVMKGGKYIFEKMADLQNKRMERMQRHVPEEAPPAQEEKSQPEQQQPPQILISEMMPNDSLFDQSSHEPQEHTSDKAAGFAEISAVKSRNSELVKNSETGGDEFDDESQKEESQKEDAVVRTIVRQDPQQNQTTALKEPYSEPGFDIVTNRSDSAASKPHTTRDNVQHLINEALNGSNQTWDALIASNVEKLADAEQMDAEKPQSAEQHVEKPAHVSGGSHPELAAAQTVDLSFDEDSGRPERADLAGQKEAVQIIGEAAPDIADAFDYIASTFKRDAPKAAQDGKPDETNLDAFAMPTVLQKAPDDSGAVAPEKNLMLRRGTEEAASTISEEKTFDGQQIKDLLGHGAQNTSLTQPQEDDTQRTRAEEPAKQSIVNAENDQIDKKMDQEGVPPATEDLGGKPQAEAPLEALEKEKINQASIDLIFAAIKEAKIEPKEDAVPTLTVDLPKDADLTANHESSQGMPQKRWDQPGDDAPVALNQPEIPQPAKEPLPQKAKQEELPVVEKPQQEAPAAAAQMSLTSQLDVLIQSAKDNGPNAAAFQKFEAINSFGQAALEKLPVIALQPEKKPDADQSKGKPAEIAPIFSDITDHEADKPASALVDEDGNTGFYRQRISGRGPERDDQQIQIHETNADDDIMDFAAFPAEHSTTSEQDQVF